ncbi:zinc metallopeptidase [Taklimakanibacter lacteus]|uniref:zinc metallopeptidase n=1 Tax=Taklimakanibacter lacteus TaxID=2268456 RepID=UPI000E662E0F
MLFIALGIVALLALIFGPQMWIRRTIARHAQERADFPGTGGELARHLLDEAGLQSVKVESIEAGDHYSPVDKAVRLAKANYEGKSVTAVAIAAHEASHAMQDAEGYGPLHLRQKLVGYAIVIEKTGSVLLLATPVIFALTRSPLVLAFELVAGLGILASTVVLHIVTLPTEFDASFKRALPILTHYVRPEDMKGARQVLRAAAFTYVASALVSLIDVARWIRILRF